MKAIVKRLLCDGMRRVEHFSLAANHVPILAAYAGSGVRCVRFRCRRGLRIERRVPQQDSLIVAAAREPACPVCGWGRNSESIDARIVRFERVLATW